MDLTCMSFSFPLEAETTRSGTENLIYSPKINKRTHVFFSFLFFNEGKTNVGRTTADLHVSAGVSMATSREKKKPPQKSGNNHVT